MRLMLTILIAIAPTLAFTQGTSKAQRPRATSTRPSSFRLGILGSALSSHLKENYENTDVTENNSGSVTLFGELGRGLVSGEIGASFIQMSDVVTVIAADKTTHPYLVNTVYVGAPILLKLNASNETGSRFSLKAGAMPMWLAGQRTANAVVSAPEFSTHAILGVTGAASVGEKTALLVDLSFFQKIGDARDGVLRNGATLGLGFSREI